MFRLTGKPGITAESALDLAGGQVTYHGPGQLVIYPLLDLRRLKMSIRDLVVRLENAVIALCADAHDLTCLSQRARGASRPMQRRSFLTLMGLGSAALGGAACKREIAGARQPHAPTASDGKAMVILGGGFGGITAAAELRRALPHEHRVMLIERRETFMMGLRKQWLLVGAGNRGDGERPLAALRGKGIDVRQGTISAIDLAHRVVRTDKEEIAFDYLVVALGAEPRPDLVPGFSAASFNMYDAQDVERLHARLLEFQRGRVAIVIFGLPFKCPPAPYEAAMLLDQWFRKRGIRSEIDLRIFTPQPMTLPVAGKEASTVVQQLLEERTIALSLSKQASRIDGTTVVFDQEKMAADILIVVPPHRPPTIIKASGLATAGDWIGVDAHTMSTSQPGVWAVGDVTQIAMANGAPFPKAGVFAEAQGRAAAAAIVAAVTGSPPATTFDGKGYCFVETGDGKASAIVGEFLTSPAPKVDVLPPHEENYRKKIAFERDRLAASCGIALLQMGNAAAPRCVLESCSWRSG
ncbi:MAG: FAD-dependent oxidoreductase [Gammaproteobacteria bacterium]